MYASQCGHLEVARELMENGADINAKNKEKRRYKDGQH